MKRIHRLLRFLFPKSYTKNVFNLKNGHEIQYVFTDKASGVEYFRFVNELNIPVERAFAAQDIYAEFEERTDKVYHEASYTAIISCLKKGDNIAAGGIANKALERMQHITNVDLLYKLASVLYFDVNENVYSYDTVYNQSKIASWKSNPDAYSFFLQTPLAEYLTLFNGSEMNLETYMKVQRKDQLKTLQSLISKFSETEKDSDIFIRAQSQIEILQGLENLGA